jgi:hypothetical protein
MERILKADTPEDAKLIEEINAFCRRIKLDDATNGRHSLVLLLDLYFGAVVRGSLDPFKVILEIQALEEGANPSRTKPPALFTGPLLGGLWHKHYLEIGVPSLAKNLRKGLNMYGMPAFERKIQAAKDANEERFLEKEDVAELVNEVVHGHYTRLAEESKLTGEWLVFAKHEGKNYYLCLGKHGDDKSIRARIEAACFAEFPFLQHQLAPPVSA